MIMNHSGLPCEFCETASGTTASGVTLKLAASNGPRSVLSVGVDGTSWAGEYIVVTVA